MGLLDFLFRGPPTPAKFAAMFTNELRGAGVAQPIDYDRENNRLLVGAGDDRETINLGNFLREYIDLPWSKRRQHLADRAKLFATKREEVASDFDEARGHLRPKLWVRAAIQQMRLQVEIDGGDPEKFDIPEYECGSHLVASLVYDLPQTMQSVSQQQFRDCGVSDYEALEIARENLEQVPCSYAQIGDGCYAFMTGDSYDCCRLLLPSLVDRLQVKGDLIAMVPNRDTLLVTGTDDQLGLKIMADLGAKALEDPRPMVPIPLRRDGDDWVDWLPPSGHPAERQLRDLARRFSLDVYTEQKQQLEQIFEDDAVELFVASYTLVKKQDEGRYSYAVWANGVKTLLPRAEWLMFMRGEDDLAAVAPWEKAEQIVGRLMKQTDRYPARYEVLDFPTDAELARRGKGEP